MLIAGVAGDPPPSVLALCGQVYAIRGRISFKIFSQLEKLYTRNYETKPISINERGKVPYIQPKQDDRTRNQLFAEPWVGLFRKSPDNGRAAPKNRQSSCILAVLTAELARFEDGSA